MAVTLTEAKVFRDVWSIPDFLCRMRPNTASVDRGNQSEGGPSSCLRTKRMTVPLRGRGAGQSSEWRLTCWPNQASESGDLQNAVELRLINYTKNKNQDGEVEAKVIIGLRDKYGDLDVVKHVVCKVRNEQMISATVPHEKITASADRLLHRGMLLIYLEIEILLPDTSAINRSSALARCSTADLRHSMLDAPFVDLGPSSVLLVFKDGEQRCHTFPLVARDQ